MFRHTDYELQLFRCGVIHPSCSDASLCLLFTVEYERMNVCSSAIVKCVLGHCCCWVLVCLCS